MNPAEEDVVPQDNVGAQHLTRHSALSREDKLDPENLERLKAAQYTSNYSTWKAGQVSTIKGSLEYWLVSRILMHEIWLKKQRAAAAAVASGAGILHKDHRSGVERVPGVALLLAPPEGGCTVYTNGIFSHVSDKDFKSLYENARASSEKGNLQEQLQLIVCQKGCMKHRELKKDTTAGAALKDVIAYVTRGLKEAAGFPKNPMPEGFSTHDSTTCPMGCENCNQMRTLLRWLPGVSLTYSKNIPVDMCQQLVCHWLDLPEMAPYHSELKEALERASIKKKAGRKKNPSSNPNRYAQGASREESEDPDEDFTEDEILRLTLALPGPGRSNSSTGRGGNPRANRPEEGPAAGAGGGGAGGRSPKANTSEKAPAASHAGRRRRLANSSSRKKHQQIQRMMGTLLPWLYVPIQGEQMQQGLRPHL